LEILSPIFSVEMVHDSFYRQGSFNRNGGPSKEKVCWGYFREENSRGSLNIL